MTDDIKLTPAESAKAYAKANGLRINKIGPTYKAYKASQVIPVAEGSSYGVLETRMAAFIKNGHKTSPADALGTAIGSWHGMAPNTAKTTEYAAKGGKATQEARAKTTLTNVPPVSSVYWGKAKTSPEFDDFNEASKKIIGECAASLVSGNKRQWALSFILDDETYEVYTASYQEAVGFSRRMYNHALRAGAFYYSKGAQRVHA